VPPRDQLAVLMEKAENLPNLTIDELR